MTSDSVASIDKIDPLNEDEEYYLVETKASYGYVQLTDPIPVTMELTNTYTPKPGSTSGPDKPASDPYDWTQSVKLALGSSSWVHRTDETGTNDLTQTAVNATSQNETIYYDIANNAGVALPNTGGPGTGLLYFLGIMLTCLSGAGLVIRKRSKM